MRRRQKQQLKQAALIGGGVILASFAVAKTWQVFFGGNRIRKSIVVNGPAEELHSAWLAFTQHSESPELDGLDIPGALEFESARGGRAGRVRIALDKAPGVGCEVKRALRAFKSLVESGEISTTRMAGQWGVKRGEIPHAEEPVQAASEDSFPASDPPAWTGTGV